jgi:hypothetical protein
MKPGDLIRIKRQLFWRTDRNRTDGVGCLALVLEVFTDAQSWNAIGRSSHAVRLMIGGTPYLIRLDPTDVEIL